MIDKITREKMKQSSEKFYIIFSFIYPVIDIFLKAQKEKLFQKVNSMEKGKVLVV
jgi:hypothetical protein